MQSIVEIICFAAIIQSDVYFILLLLLLSSIRKNKIQIIQSQSHDFLFCFQQGSAVQQTQHDENSALESTCAAKQLNMQQSSKNYCTNCERSWKNMFTSDKKNQSVFNNYRQFQWKFFAKKTNLFGKNGKREVLCRVIE